MAMHVEELPIAPRPVFDEFGHSGNGRRARPCQPRHLPVTEPFAQLPRHFKPFTPRLQFAKGADIPQEIRHIFISAARRERLAESLEPRLFAVAIFGEAFARWHE